MRKSRFSEEQIIGAIKRMDAGVSAADLGRELGVNQYTLYRWKRKYGGLEVSDARKLCQLEDENARLKRTQLARQAGAEGIPCDLQPASGFNNEPRSGVMGGSLSGGTSHERRMDDGTFSRNAADFSYRPAQMRGANREPSGPRVSVDRREPPAHSPGMQMSVTSRVVT